MTLVIKKCKSFQADLLFEVVIYGKPAIFFLYIYNLHFFKQKVYSHQVLIYLIVPGISVRKPLQNRQMLRNNWMCEF